MHNCKNKIATQFVPPDIRNTFRVLYILASIKYFRIQIVQYLINGIFIMKNISAMDLHIS